MEVKFLKPNYYISATTYSKQPVYNEIIQFDIPKQFPSEEEAHLAEEVTEILSNTCLYASIFTIVG